ncbi:MULTISPECIES: hypothetical protein [unclassified Mycobacterium]|uniref:hypothetical protein n=1 Tax=unclassified Mycobacterium TaxID=2642494 RepID=UPI0011175B1C|nr:MULTISPECIES: hypothetical protein [unclassified Mycobacterium]
MSRKFPHLHIELVGSDASGLPGAWRGIALLSGREAVSEALLLWRGDRESDWQFRFGLAPADGSTALERETDDLFTHLDDMLVGSFHVPSGGRELM